MRKIIASLILCLSMSYSYAQITSIAMSVNDLKDAPFKFKGTRAMMVDRIDDGSSKDIFVFSKVPSGSNPDTLYAEKFTKIGEVWKLTQEKTITYNGIISIWGARKGFTDADKDKQVDAFFIYSLHDADFKKQLSVHLLLFHKGESYTLSQTDEGKESQSKNFSSLPESIKTEVLAYWNKLDKK
ncbi:hypothetical protein [Pedobacter punctiformis]|uniref:Uncharacterized protein n=1 Tax=Pedobacter punctiformis TaxID=3004097 RepID=A0ABT4LB81_9SPHI|nr:hypothetical protein [Pedobacter sp. HCMS5-2]MCZ4245165.1 hypothetical protein [Pedobacter sp. HCMS5-2]